METKDWYKIKGYYHFSSQVAYKWKEKQKVIQRIKNPKYVEQYAFFPLLHTNIKERRYKEHPIKEGDNKKPVRVHSYFDEKKGKFVKTEKLRPLHYANHTDALIYSYYAMSLGEKYEKLLKSDSELDNAVTAYRKIPIPGEFKKDGSQKNKGSIHFAADVFNEIKKRTADDQECAVLAFDIKSFFPSLDHSYLKEKWCEVLKETSLPKEHQNVFNSVTNFSFIYKDDLRKFQAKKGRRANFDEKQIAEIRNQHGINAFFESPAAFRKAIRTGKVRVYKNSFKNEEKEMIGIPQGLPMSAVLANIYLLDFDKKVIEYLVKNKGAFYRRYSDDIILICDKNFVNKAEQFIIDEMENAKVKISKEKTEKFIFKTANNRITVHKVVLENSVEILKDNQPLIYLGFEFYGYQTLIKSTNLSKFYRRMIYAVKNKARIANKIAEKKGTKPVLFKSQLYPLYQNIDLERKFVKRNYKVIEKLPNGEFRTKIDKKKKKHNGNYFSYVERAAEILDAPEIKKQLRNEKRIFNEAMSRHLKRNKSKG